MSKICAKIYMSVILLILCGCSATIDYRGKQPELADVEKIKINQHNQEDVLSIIGSPTSTNLYGPTKWYYLFKRTESTSFFDPKIIQEQIVTISFSDKGNVTDIKTSQDVEKKIDTVTQQTPTQGSNTTILQQVFGNFGRHAKKADSDK